MIAGIELAFRGESGLSLYDVVLRRLAGAMFVDDCDMGATAPLPFCC